MALAKRTAGSGMKRKERRENSLARKYFNADTNSCYMSFSNKENFIPVKSSLISAYLLIPVFIRESHS